MVKLPESGDWDMVVFDVDGTLLDIEGYHVDLVSLARSVDSEVMTVSLASGRTLPNVTPIRQSLGVSGFVIAENGGMIWDSDEGHDIVALADGARAKEAAEWLSTQIDGLDPRGIESNRWRETEWCLKETHAYEQIETLLNESEWSDLEVITTGFAVHIAKPGLNKANGLLLALEQRGIDPQRVIACGDAPNDIPMFDVVGFSVAVNDAYPGVVEAANCVTDNPGKDGSVELLRELLRRG
ncbi:MAG: HAD hydrolase family protein [Candidatus Thermoplasmatota archaeon]|nr:HAD hydrolase family protein [Candidatus Thermoplasmatota archaeon]